MFDTPGVLSAGPFPEGNLSEQYASGVDWHALQVQNDDRVSTPLLYANTIRSVGMKPVAWGVTYDARNFARDGAALASAARAIGAAGLIIDAEEVLKSADPRPLIAALSVFEGPKALTTMGATSDWARWTFDIEIGPWVDAGYWVMPQAYYNEDDSFLPAYCAAYWDRVGWPVERTNLMIGTHRSAPDKQKPNNRITGQAWQTLLSEISRELFPNRRAVSIFLAGTTETADYKALAPFLSRPVSSSSDPRQQAIDALRPVVEAWQAKGMSEKSVLRQRIGFALRVLELDLPSWYGPNFENVDELIVELLDRI